METTPVPFYLLFSRRDRPVDRLRRHLGPAKWQTMITWPRRLGYICFVLGWPLIAAWYAWRACRQNGATVRTRTGLSKSRQFLEQWVLASWGGIAPAAYYRYGLFDRSRRSQSLNFLHNQELNSIADALNAGKDLSVLTNKVTFAETCARLGLPAIPTLTVFYGGAARGDIKSHADLPPHDLFAKPVEGTQGFGVRAWKYLGEDQYERRYSGETISRRRLFNHLLELSARRAYVLQPRIVNHPNLMELTKYGLCTVRMVTARDIRGGIELLVAVFKMPTCTRLADNLAAGGIAAGVDLATGRLHSGADKKSTGIRFECHPDTGKPIAGTVLPWWPEAKQLCLDAHSRLSDVFLLGWDVAITASGPILVEGNCSPCVELMQKGTDTPLGGSPLNRMCLEHFQVRQNRLPAVPQPTLARSH